MRTGAHRRCRTRTPSHIAPVSPNPFPPPPQMMYKKILEADLEAPHFMSDAALDLCQRLLIRDPTLRLGSGATGVEDMKSHAFFRGIDWAALELKLVGGGRWSVGCAGGCAVPGGRRL
jgi:hypothetical protein